MFKPYICAFTVNFLQIDYYNSTIRPPIMQNYSFLLWVTVTTW